MAIKKERTAKPEIVPDEAEIIRLIYKLFLDGYSMRNTKNHLESKGVLTAQGKKIWNESLISSILKNEKYVGDALMQKTYTLDCITHKVVKNKGERPMFLVTDHHDPIVDRDTYNRVQQELARRSSKRKISDKTTTEQGRYSSKYALTELLICGHCGTPYRRTTWSSRGKKLIVWRCISRLEHGNRYCKNSPTIHEEPLHRAIVKAINEFYNCSEEAAKILRNNAENALLGLVDNEIQTIENRLKEIEVARNDFINLIAEKACDEDSLDEEFEKLFAEEENLSDKLISLKSQNTAEKSNPEIDKITSSKFELEQFNDIIIRKVIECVKVLSKTEILIVFKGGFEVKVDVDKK